MAVPRPIHKVLFSPDGKHLATGNGTVYILRLPMELTAAKQP
jgi:hypothetical protein